MASPTITTGKKDYLPPSIPVLSTAFAHDPVITYLLSSLSPTARTAYLSSYFRALLTAASLNGAIFYEAGDWSCCGVLMPPGTKVDNPFTLIPAGIFGVLWNIGVGGCYRMLGEYGPLADECKRKVLKGEERYYYVFNIGTKEEARGKGLCSEIVKLWQEQATQEQIPIWLEATTASSARLYSRLGFETVDEIVLGKGKADATGNTCKGREGVKIWGMIWRPQANKSS